MLKHELKGGPTDAEVSNRRRPCDSAAPSPSRHLRRCIVPGVFDPGNTGCVKATYIGKQKTLHLEKNCPTATNAAAGADITRVSGQSGPVCVVHAREREPVSGWLPRFNVVTTTGVFFLGCNNVTPTTNANGTATYTFTAATLAAGGPAGSDADRHDPVRGMAPSTSKAPLTSRRSPSTASCRSWHRAKPTSPARARRAAGRALQIRRSRTRVSASSTWLTVGTQRRRGASRNRTASSSQREPRIRGALVVSAGLRGHLRTLAHVRALPPEERGSIGHDEWVFAERSALECRCARTLRRATASRDSSARRQASGGLRRRCAGLLSWLLRRPDGVRLDF